MTDDTPPVARVDPAPRWSAVWLVPLAAAALAGVLGWQSWGARGTTVHIRFEHGHGLRAGDTLRHRGIVAGEVVDVSYAAGEDGVRVALALAPDAEGLARVGSRFWVVRPSFGWAGVTGLDTLVGDRYLEVIPGGGPPQRHFVGLDRPPIPDALLPGLDIVLEGSSRGSLVAGSPVTYRRIQVGSVLSVSLASDGRSVEVQARIREEYAALVRPGTRFWETSGVGLDVGITGASLHLESLESLVRGGVALATPGEGERVSTGHRFTLATRPDPAWLTWRPSIPIGHSLLPPGAPVPHPRRAQLAWQEGRLWSSDERREGWVLGVPGAMLGPADLLTAPEDAHADSAVIEVAGRAVPLAGDPTAVADGLARRPAPDDLDLPAWPRALQRAPDGPEDCLAVTDPGSPPLTLAPGALEATDEGWLVDRAIPLDDRWHGAPVLARSDGRLIGLVVVESEGARVVPLPRPLP